jgi:hypothetical protein
VNTFEDFLALLRHELGLAVTEDAAVDQVPGWDSVHLLSLLTVLEGRTGRRIHLPDLLEAGTLKEMYDVAVAR